MNIVTLKRRVVRACFMVTLCISAAAYANNLTIDTVDKHLVETLTHLSNSSTTRSPGSLNYQQHLQTYIQQRDMVKQFLRNFLDTKYNGSPEVFLRTLSALLTKFKMTVVDPMAHDQHLTRVHQELAQIYHEFVQFKGVLEANKHQKSAWVVAPQFMKYTHLVFNDLRSAFSAKNVLDGLGHRLRCTGTDIGNITIA